MSNKVTAPRALSKEAAALYVSTITTYAIDDEFGRKILCSACEALDRMREAQAVLRKQGLQVRDKNGIARMHPCVGVERIARASFIAAFRALSLEPPRAPK